MGVLLLLENMSTTRYRMESPSSGQYSLVLSGVLPSPVTSTFLFRFDQEGSKVNSLSEETSAELQEAFQKFAGDSSAKSAVLLSGKPGCFIAGADIQMLAR